jgi:hypothetical protein
MSNGTIITLKKSTTAGTVPAASSLYQAELAINTADANLFAKRDDGTVLIQSIGSVQANHAELLDTTTDQLLDSMDASVYRSAKYVIQSNHASEGFQTIEILLMHDGANAYITRYGLMYTENELALFTASFDSINNTLNLLTTPQFNNVSYKWTRTVVQA